MGTFSPDALVPAHHPELQVVFDRDKRCVLYLPVSSAVDEYVEVEFDSVGFYM